MCSTFSTLVTSCLSPFKFTQEPCFFSSHQSSFFQPLCSFSAVRIGFQPPRHLPTEGGQSIVTRPPSTCVHRHSTDVVVGWTEGHRSLTQSGQHDGPSYLFPLTVLVTSSKTRSRRFSAPPALVLVTALFTGSSFAESNSDNT